MDIYKILKEDSSSVLDVDLDFFEIELATGEYDKEYIEKCRELIYEIKQFRKENNSKEDKKDINPTLKNEDSNASIEGKKSETSEEAIKSLIGMSRVSPSYHDDFDKIVKDYNVSEDFVEKNYLFFKPIEMDELLQLINFSESFLEKHLKILNNKLIAEYQLFSEEFFIKHFDKLDYKIVLKKGKNPWAKKKQRSSKLTVFLKLKGITI